MDNYFGLYKEMLPNSVKLTYKGKVTFDLVDSILSIISGRLDSIEEDINTRKKVYTVLMECLQNLCNYIEEQDFETTLYDSNCALLSITNGMDEYSIYTGNFMLNERVSSLKSWLDQINASDGEERKQLYNKILTNNTFSSKGGGGLGFLDIARKSNGNLIYAFQQVDDNCSFFSLEINIKRN